MTKSNKGAIIIFFSAALWGLFWIPLRYIEESGLTGLWAVTVVFVAGGVFAIPIFLYQMIRYSLPFASLLVVGFLMGLAGVLYFSALIFTDVIRAVFLFYLLPFWAILSARIIYSVPINKIQILAGGIALIGLYMLLGGDGDIPLPRNIGDWFAIVAGITWGTALTLIRGQPESEPFGIISFTFIFGIIIALMMIYLFPQTMAEDNKSVNITLIPIIVTFILAGVFIVPSIYGQAWGARFISSATASILTMSEVLAATISYWILENTTLTYIAIGGGILMIIAGILGLQFADEDAKIEK